MFAKIVRYLLALIFIVFGLNKFIGFLPAFEFPEGSAAGAYFAGLVGSGYFFPLLALTEIAVGLLLAINKFVPLALVIYAPVALNILLFHLSMAPGLEAGLVGYVVFLATAYLLYANKEKYSALLTA